MKRMSLLRIVGILCLALTKIGYSQGTVVDDSFFSPALGTTRLVDVYLPSGYNPNDPTVRYPVIYLLHGYGGNQDSYRDIDIRSLLDSLITSEKIEPVIVIMPDGSIGHSAGCFGSDAGSYYTNSDLYGRFEDYIVEDVLSFIDSSYNTLATRNKRCIMGYSMGGQGAMGLALKHPDVFRGVASHSGGLDFNQFLTSGWIDSILHEHRGAGPFRHDAGRFSPLFFATAGAYSPNLANPPCLVDLPIDNSGNTVGSTFAKWLLHSPANLAASLPRDSNLAIYFDCGTNDEYRLLPFNTGFADSLKKLGHTYTFQSYAGRHSDQLNSRIPIALRFLDSAMRTVEDLDMLSDEFDNPATLSNWLRLDQVEGWPNKLLALDIDQTEPGHLYMEPDVCTWFQDHVGPLIFKEVAGNFVVETRIRVRGRNTDIPQRRYSLSGLFVRAPRNITVECPTNNWPRNGENWMFLTIGAGDTAGQPELEAKNTINSVGFPQLSEADAGWVQLRITRVDHNFMLDYCFPGQPWVNHRRFIRTDMPNTLQVGLTAYTDWEADSACARQRGVFACNCSLIPGNPDLKASVDYVRFSRPITTGVATGAERQPEGFALFQNYPNPFNPVTSIQYSVNSHQFVSLKVYDVLGNEVATLVDERQAPGVYRVDFAGANVPSGVYFFKLIAGDFAATRKMLLVR